MGFNSEFKGLRNPKVHNHTRRSLPLVPTLSQSNPIHVDPSYGLRSILILYSLPSCHSPVGFPTKMPYAYVFFPLHDIRPAHCLLLDFIALIIFDEFKSRSFSFSNFLHSSAFSPAPLVWPSNFLRTYWERIFFLVRCWDRVRRISASNVGVGVRKFSSWIWDWLAWLACFIFFI